MPKPDHVIIALENPTLQQAMSGGHNFVNRMLAVLQAVDISVSLELTASLQPFTDDYVISHMKGPIGPNTLYFRKAIEFPFWHIDAEAERWNWSIAGAEFDPSGIDPKKAEKFVHRHRKRLYGGAERQKDFVLVPLQGCLQDRRSFQAASPIDMVKRVCDTHASRRIIATLHPKEDYTDVEMAALNALEAECDNLTVQTGGSLDLVKRCALVVTQNSGVAFTGYLFHKPAVLFGKTDVHHIAGWPDELGAEPEIAPEVFDVYVYWYWQQMCINGGHPDCDAQILRDLRQSGWDI